MSSSLSPGLRQATVSDLPRLIPMMKAFNLLEGIDWDPAGARPAIIRLMEDSSLGTIGLVERGDRLVGYFVLTWGFDLEWNGRDSFLTEIYLEPAARGQGVGSRMLALIEDLARERGAAAVHLMVRPENEAAVNLYASAGYVSPPRTFLSKALRPKSTD
jgi:ribosomal protein S18 acetylase RimI-like enzyme